MSSYENNGKNDHRFTANKYWQFILISFIVAVLQCIFRSNTNLSSVSSFIRSSSKGSDVGGDSGSYNAHYANHHRPQQQQVVEAASDTATVLLIHYHKTGNNLVVDLLRQIHRTAGDGNLTMKEPSVLKRMNKKTKGHLKRGQEKHEMTMIGQDDMDDDEFEDNPVDRTISDNSEGSNSWRQNETKGTLWKRSHDPRTGCPILGDTDFEVGAAYRLVAPNFFCNLSMTPDNAADDDDDAEMEHSANSERKPAAPHSTASNRHHDRQKLPFPAWETTKIVHFVRDPIDMALSNYLYHSQHPTPEPWIKRKGINPCRADEKFVKYALKELNGGASTRPRQTLNITEADLLQVSTMCQHYKNDHVIAKSHPNKTSRSFYGILRRLPAYDGLRFATSHFLMAQSESGGDLLRMPNNMLRLQEWEAQGQARPSHILTMPMGKIVKDMNGSILQICDFIFGHISNVTARSEISEEIAQKMVAKYQAKTKASNSIHGANNLTENITSKSGSSTMSKETDLDNKNWTLRQRSHVTQGIMNDTERQLLKQQLEEDPILGHILLQLREVVNSF